MSKPALQHEETPLQSLLNFPSSTPAFSGPHYLRITLAKPAIFQCSNDNQIQVFHHKPSIKFTKNYQLSFRFGLAIPRQRFSKKKLIQSGPLILPGPMFVCFAASSYHPTPPEQSSSSTHCSDNLLLVCCRYLALSNPPLGVKFQYNLQQR